MVLFAKSFGGRTGGLLLAGLPLDNHMILRLVLLVALTILPLVSLVCDGKRKIAATRVAIDPIRILVILLHSLNVQMQRKC